MGKVKHYIQTEDLTPEELMEIIHRSERYEKDPKSTYHLCEGKVIATMFFKESTRTATLFQTAMQKMGGGWFGIQGIAGTYIASGEEDEEDTLRAVAPYADIMAIRHNYLDLNKFADTFPIPMVNGMVGGDEANCYFDCFENNNMSLLEELHGVVASPGQVRGRVRLVKTSEDMTKFGEGEILVTNQTTPEFVPAMKKAAAIVTEQGGITSHAAIISRELKTPCIIGTKIATKVFRDGDMVEVDANKGIVRKIGGTND